MNGGNSVGLLALKCMLLLFCMHGVLLAEIAPEKVLVVANIDAPDSMHVADYYMKKRGIPPRNLIALSLSPNETIKWQEYVDTLHNPLMKHLVDRKWIDAQSSTQQDDAGRDSYSVYGHSIDFLVLCPFVPLRIEHDASLLVDNLSKQLQKEFATTQASVDSEVAVMPFLRAPPVGYLPNPLFRKLRAGKFTAQQIIRVARLDGPNIESIKHLVDSAMKAESSGLRGRAYIDYGKKYAQGDQWLEEVQAHLEVLDFPMSINNDASLFAWRDRFDAPAFYFGWWSSHADGPVSDPYFRFPPGAIALHIHSFSASTIRNSHSNWVGPLVEKGVTATMGNVFEPYLQLTHHPHLLVEGLKKGLQLGEAAYYALPVLSWQSILVGDPLYKPQMDLAAQLREIEAEGTPPDAYSQYSVLRQMEHLKKTESLSAACQYGIRMFVKAPGLALGYEIAKCLSELGRKDDATRMLQFLESKPMYEGWEQTLAVQVASFLEREGANELALSVYRNVLETPNINSNIARIALPNAQNLAYTFSEGQLANKWWKWLVRLRSDRKKE